MLTRLQIHTPGTTVSLWWSHSDKGQNVNDIALHVHISDLRAVTCHMGSHSVTRHLTQVIAPHLTPARKAGTQLTYPGGMEG